MAGDWIKFEVSTSDKPEVWAMADKLGIDPDAVVGKLLRVWAWFDQHTENGDLKTNASSVTTALPQRYQCVSGSVTKTLLDRVVGVPGFCESMLFVGWMTEDERGLHLPNFDRHNGKTAKTRALTAKRVANHKTKGNAPSVTTANATSVTFALPREEKRREEKKEENPPLSPDGGKTDPPKEKLEQPEKPHRTKRPKAETVGEFEIPEKFDTPEIRQALKDFESMRLSIGKRIKNRGNVCKSFANRFVDAKHLLACIEVAISNEYQGISPDYVDPSKVQQAPKPSLWDTVKKY